jgi:hypothetical protein
MKRMIPGLWILALLSCTPSKKYYDKVDAQAGFQDLTLDSSYELLKGKVEMQLMVEDTCRATKKYRVTSQKYLQIGTVRFNKVELEFVHDSLYRTTLYTKETYVSMGQLHAKYRQEFGEPQEVKSVDYKSTNWNGKNYTIHLVDRVRSNDFEVEYASIRGINKSIDAEKACEEGKPQ